MGMTSRIKREIFIRLWIRRGYSRKLANAYYRKVLKDRLLDNGISPEEKEWAYNHKFLSESIEKYDLRHGLGKYISDVDYLWLQPFNNSFSKWMHDLVTTNHVLSGFSEQLPRLYFNIIDREHKKIFLPIDTVNREYGESYEDFLRLLNEKGELVLRPAASSDTRSAYIIRCIGEGRYKLCSDEIDMQRMRLFDYDCDQEVPGAVKPNPFKTSEYDSEGLYKLINSLEGGYVIAEPYKLREGFNGCIKLYIANKELKDTEILDAYYLPFGADKLRHLRISEQGEIEGTELKIDGWDRLRADVTDLSRFVSEIEFYSAYIVLTEDGFVIDRFNTSPALPDVAHSDRLNDYLLDRLRLKRETATAAAGHGRRVLKNKCFELFLKLFCRPGIRPYMEKLWLRSVWDDFRHTKTTNIFQKLWCWRHGFLSFRIQQYGLTKENYKDFLSDYQYHWLNRINNDYQIWINDKTTTRYVMEPKKEFLAKYYYDILKMNGKTCIKALQDIPEGFGASFDEIFRLLRREKLLALKPSSGTHGDGFYRMEYADGKYLINGNEMSELEITDMICGFKSIYIITEYLFMHRELRKIYPNSVNTIRVAVINQTGYEPKIMQTYMRIGSSKSGYTDNVGYGGICAKIDIPTGRYYCPQQIHEHKFTPCPIHPDTGVKIEGIVPNWDYMCKGVVDICKFMPELEYLGFDIAITDDGFKIIEINIHQDLHKVAEHSEEFKAFYRDKLKLKAEQYGLKKW